MTEVGDGGDGFISFKLEPRPIKPLVHPNLNDSNNNLRLVDASISPDTQRGIGGRMTWRNSYGD